MIQRVVGMYFSPTGTTKKVVMEIAQKLSEKFDCNLGEIDFTLPEDRKKVQSFGETDLVVFGTPVYAGRVPNVLLKYIDTLEGGGALAVPVAVYGNRAYEDSLAELQALLHEDGFIPVAAGAFIGEHSMSYTLAAGRPDVKDMEIISNFADGIYKKVTEENLPEEWRPLAVGGEWPSKGYYKPQDRNGNFIDIRKVVSKVSDKCNDCKICAEVCPMGSISYEDVRIYTGICIKCGSCVKRCPTGARYYDDEKFLYHVHEVEDCNMDRKEPETFL